MQHARAHVLSAAIVAMTTLVACTRTDADEADDALDRDQTASTSPLEQMQPATPPRTAMQPSSETAPAMPESETDAAPQLTDEQVFAMINVMGDKEMELARLAQQRGRSKEVRAYAAMVIAHGQDAKNRRTKLSQSTAFAPARSDASQTIVMDSKADLEALKNTSREDFDKAFIKIPAGQLVNVKPKRARNRIATSPGGSSPFGSGAYVIPCPLPEGMRANCETSKVWPSRSTVMVTGEPHVFAT
jgi:predicted outer membrane protein